MALEAARAVVPSHCCRLCGGKGRLGTGWLSAGEPCRACGTRGHTLRRQRKCLLCSASGKVQHGWLSTTQCPACEGACYVTKRQVPCRRCQGKGITFTGVLGLSQTKCPACYGSCFVQAKQFPCQRCDGDGRVRSGLLGVSSSDCTACEAAGVVHFKQHKCRKCNGLGAARGATCDLCEGRCYLAFDHTPCAKCGGVGKLSGWWSTQSCPSCEATPGYVMLSRLTFATDSGTDSDSDSAATDSSYLSDGDDRRERYNDGHDGQQHDRWHGGPRPRSLPALDVSEADADDESHRLPTPSPHRPPHAAGPRARSGGPARSRGWQRTVAAPMAFAVAFFIYRLSRPDLEPDE